MREVPWWVEADPTSPACEGDMIPAIATRDARTNRLIFDAVSVAAEDMLRRVSEAEPNSVEAFTRIADAACLLNALITLNDELGPLTDGMSTDEVLRIIQ